MSAVEFIDCKASDGLALFPRGVYRLTVVRTARVLDWMTSLTMSGRSWPSIVGEMSDRIPSTKLAFPLSSYYAPEGDAVGVIDVRVSSSPGYYTIADMVTRLNDLSAFCDIARVHRYPQVPGLSESGPEQLATGRVDEQTAAQAEEDAKPSAFTTGLESIQDIAKLPGRVVGNVAGDTIKELLSALAPLLVTVGVVGALALTGYVVFQRESK